MSAVVTTPAGTAGGDTYEPPPEPVAGAKRRWWVPYVQLFPGGLWLVIFFALPVALLAQSTLWDPAGSLENGYELTWRWQNFSDGISTYSDQFLRSLGYALVATILCLIIGYPLAYAIALKAGRWRNLMLIGVIAPFFTSFLVRTLAWKTILSDHGWVMDVLRMTPFFGPDDRLLATPAAVIAGLTYNFVPFMVLPLYASLGKLDPRLLEAAGDLYAHPIKSFFRVTLPLSMPGVVGGTLMTFIPAAGDYINAELLGSPATTMIGNVIQSQYLRVGDIPVAAALSFTLMAGILILVAIYVAVSGTDEVV
ncbi:MAG: ABC transporter permease [Hamadaea sp.]|uniref:ABC transporter permease n=1 Tax=Hamadaea sp. TaxID=2024425 RepID=UPI0017BF94E0|nr:ABC transporter permease [Hamadaea sp.]NUR71458.1 ABC transporter permease [Hamadaea sp.]NUT23321.1 ABC transporter permease [Hamadaea sp.]